MFEGQPKGLYALALANTGERFGYYTMIAVFALFLRANFGLDAGWAGEIFSDFLMPDRCGKLRRNTQLPKEYMSYAVSANGLQTILRSFLLCLRQRSRAS